MDEIRYKKKLPTEGAAAIDNWVVGLNLGDERWRHGKDFLAAIRSAFQLAVGANLKSNVPSPHLVVPELRDWIAATKPAPAAVAPGPVAPAVPTQVQAPATANGPAT